MSNDISYILRVTDEFSANIKKFKKEIKSSGNEINQYAESVTKAQKSSKFFTDNLKDLAKATGLYIGFQEIKNFGKEVFSTKIQMDSLEASLTAIMPKFDKTRSGTQLAAEEIEYLKGVTEKLGISFKQALPSYMQFLASSKQDLPTTRKTFEAFAGISRVYGLSADRFGLVINALGQMQSKSVVSMEELRQQLGDSLPGALDLFSEAAGMSTVEFTKLMADGRIGAGILKNVAEVIEKKFGKDIINASKTLGAQTERLGNNWLMLKSTLGNQLGPTMSSTVLGLTDLTSGITSVIGAVNNQKAFVKLDEDMQTVVLTLRIMRDLLVSVGEAVSNVSKIIGGFWNFGKDLISTATIGVYQAAGVAQMAAGVILPGQQDELVRSGQNKITTGGEAFGEIVRKNQERYFAPEPPTQKIELQINHANAPKGTTVEVRSPKTNLRVGNMVEYAGGM